MSIGFTEYAAGWEYTENERGITCSRVFHFNPDDLVDHGVEPANVGDAYTFPPSIANGFPITGVGTTISGLICRSVGFRALAGDIRKIEYTASYTNEPCDNAIFVAPNNNYMPSNATQLPITIEYSGEYTVLNPASTGTPQWKWHGNNADVEQPIGARVNSSTTRFVRYVGNNTTPYNYSNFQANVLYLSGRVNDAADPFGLGGVNPTTGVISSSGGIGCFLFVGAHAEVFKNNFDNKWWRVELEFTYRNPDGLDLQGWQKVLRLDGTWDVPVKKSDSKPQYLYGNFQALFDEAKSPVSQYTFT